NRYPLSLPSPPPSRSLRPAGSLPLYLPSSLTPAPSAGLRDGERRRRVRGSSEGARLRNDGAGLRGGRGRAPLPFPNSGEPPASVPALSGEPPNWSEVQIQLGGGGGGAQLDWGRRGIAAAPPLLAPRRRLPCSPRAALLFGPRRRSGAGVPARRRRGGHAGRGTSRAPRRPSPASSIGSRWSSI
ncbi:unnamed protein product, partial [Urochloa humidicola]